MSKPAKQPVDFIRRGIKKPNPAGLLTFVGLRVLDPFLQYQLLRPGGWGAALLSRLGLSLLPASGPVTTHLDLSIAQLVLLGMSVGSALKQIYWLIALAQEDFPASSAVAVSLFNTFMNSINSFLFLWGATSALNAQAWPGTDLPIPTAIGAVLYVLGITTEAVAEYQRRRFKDQPENAGKVMKTGLWAWARHINYGGYAIWKGAYGLAGSGLVGGTAIGLWMGLDFAFRAVPVLDSYCASRYGEQWVRFKKEVPWVLFPGIY